MINGENMKKVLKLPLQFILPGLVALALVACSEEQQPLRDIDHGALSLGIDGSYVLDSQRSRISFLSVKKSTVVEQHHFASLTGSVSEQGEALIEVTLDSVQTLIDIRNERMREYLFETAEFPLASISTQVDTAMLTGLLAGDQWYGELAISLSLHGNEQRYNAQVEVTRLGDGELLVHTTQPLLLHVDDFDMAAGVAKLAELAALPSITPVVPVSARLLLTPQE